MEGEYDFLFKIVLIGKVYSLALRSCLLEPYKGTLISNMVFLQVMLVLARLALLDDTLMVSLHLLEYLPLELTSALRH
jgi:hypothetical protein